MSDLEIDDRAFEDRLRGELRRVGRSVSPSDRVDERFARQVRCGDVAMPPGSGRAARGRMNRSRRFRLGSLAASALTIGGVVSLVVIASGSGATKALPGATRTRPAPTEAEPDPTTAGHATTQAPMTRTLQLSGYSFSIPVRAAFPSHCLDWPDAMAWVKEWSANPAHPVVHFLVPPVGSDPTGSCVVGALVVTPRHPAPVGTESEPGQPTVYMAAPTATTVIGYLPQDAAESAWAAGDMEGPVGVQYNFVFEAANGTSPAALAAILRQFPLGPDASHSKWPWPKA